jgi:hypothetical protein
MSKSSLKCTVCTTDIEVPHCCENNKMSVKDGKLVCFLCGSDKEIPICCGKKMKLMKSTD